MEWAAILGGAGVAVLAITSTIIATRMASSRAGRADTVTDKLLTTVDTLETERTLHAATQKALDVAVENTRQLEAALATAEAETHKAEASATSLEESFHELLNATMSAAPPPAIATAIQSAATAAADRLRASLGRLRSQTQAVPRVPPAAAAADPGGGKNPGLPDGAGSGQAPVPR